MTRINPRVSIIIPVYNGSNFLTDAIESALAQTYQNIEIVVINDGSSDGGKTERIALSYGDKISYYQKKNGGVASALNFGIKKMTGDYFSWLSHDDMYEKSKVEEEVEYLLAQPDSKNTIVACNSFTLFENGIKKKDKINQDVFDNYFDIFMGASAKVGINGCSLLIPKHTLVRSGGFDESLPVTQDYDLWNRLRGVSKFVLLDKSLVIYRHHDMQDSIQKSNLSLIAGDELRSRILRGVSRSNFELFMTSSKSNKKWLWENYMTYKARGYIKIPLMILYLLARYYGSDSQIKSEVLSFEKYIGYNLGQHRNESAIVIDRIKDTIGTVSDKDYENNNELKNKNKLIGYIDSIRNDGLLFVLEKAIRKLVKIIRRH